MMNAILIGQSAEEAKLAWEVNQNSALKGIRLAGAEMRAPVGPRGLDQSIGVHFSFESKETEGAGKNEFRLEIWFRMSGEPETERKKRASSSSNEMSRESVVSVECRFEVEYSTRDGFDLSKEHLAAFKDGNAIFNVWPYFREFLQSSLQRMGLPPLTAPFLRMVPKAPRSDISGLPESKSITKETGGRGRRRKD